MKVSIPAVQIVDDSLANLRVLSQLIEEMGYEARVSTNGEAAIQSIHEAAPDLILMDVNMPGIDGYETVRRLKDPRLRGRRRRLPDQAPQPRRSQGADQHPPANLLQRHRPAQLRHRAETGLDGAQEAGGKTHLDRATLRQSSRHHCDSLFPESLRIYRHQQSPSPRAGGLLFLGTSQLSPRSMFHKVFQPRSPLVLMPQCSYSLVTQARMLAVAFTVSSENSQLTNMSS